ncbi:GspE/PulE family protein [Haloplasma contractile]|uniref:Ral secretory pathway protein E n=1 Tax=Haloplasma contractile SSD-17B TaxID=1033810 RepID=U2EFV2_9MOLU|nr:ATPase, T2SS/T4P/T4SS family [Haloplasma contractile]ERJ13803.1 ral secretory pathway protein E [Haloplasma contractile SSD-17B]
MKRVKKRIGDILIDAGLIRPDQIETALTLKETDEKLGDTLIRVGYVTENQVMDALALQLGIKKVSLSDYMLNETILRLISEDYARQNAVVPLAFEDGKLVVAIADPLNYYVVDDLRLLTGYGIKLVMAPKSEIETAISRHYGIDRSLDQIIHNYAEKKNKSQEEDQDDTPLIRLVNQLLLSAVKQDASDIHIDPHENEVLVRFRVDGVLNVEKRFPKVMEKQLLSRIKVLSGLDITESRRPQDGRIKASIDKVPIDLRISTLPTVNGEKVVMRLLNVKNTLGNIEKLGLSKDNYKTLRRLISNPNGIILVSGPTGSGKSSTLYASLNELNKEDVNIITIEDPVEFQLKGVNQIQVNSEIGLNFASGLRSILRQDPNIVMVGEIRDVETAQIAVRASLTGHLVLSTIHTNDSIGTVTRLTDMGIEPFLVSSSLVGVVAQRLVRRTCRECGEWEPATERERKLFRDSGMMIEKVFRPKGCSSCNQKGYSGRVAIFEILEINDVIRDLINKNSSDMEIKKVALNQRMKFLIQDGFQKVIDGVTTTEEVLRVTSI